MTREELEALVAQHAEEFVRETGDYGYGEQGSGWYSGPTVANTDVITDFIWGLLQHSHPLRCCCEYPNGPFGSGTERCPKCPVYHP